MNTDGIRAANERLEALAEDYRSGRLARDEYRAGRRRLLAEVLAGDLGSDATPAVDATARAVTAPATTSAPTIRRWWPALAAGILLLIAWALGRG